MSKDNMHNSKHLRVVFTYFWLIPLVYLLPDFFAQYLPPNKFLIVVVSLTIIVPLMSYIVVPVNIFLFGWLTNATDNLKKKK
jgi:antibiotic biosynthesis monooxygenase (ABM) superfamily enzyme